MCWLEGADGFRPGIDEARCPVEGSAKGAGDENRGVSGEVSAGDILVAADCYLVGLIRRASLRRGTIVVGALHPAVEVVRQGIVGIPLLRARRHSESANANRSIDVEGRRSGLWVRRIQHWAEGVVVSDKKDARCLSNGVQSGDTKSTGGLVAMREHAQLASAARERDIPRLHVTSRK